MLFPELPENLSELSDDQLRELSAAIRTAAATAAREHRTDLAIMTQANEAMTFRQEQVLPAIASREAADALAASTAAEEADEAAAAAAAAEAAQLATVGAPGAEAGAETDPNAGLEGRTVTTTTELSPEGTTVERVTEPQGFLEVLTAFDGVSGVRQGEQFESWTQVAEAMLSAAADIRPSSDTKHHIAKALATFPDEMRLGESSIENFRKLSAFSEADDETMAALCAPFTPNYTLACQNTLRRPVRASLPVFAAPRGGVSIYPSPTLADVAGSAGIWTPAMDANPAAVKNDCAVITCGTPEDYAMWGVYWCLTVKNMLAMTFPELLEAYLNRGGALYARTGELQLLTGMAAGLTPVDVPAQGYGASTTITTQLMKYLAFRRELQRWDDVPMKGWAHRWIQTAIRIDLSRRNRDGTWTVASEADANRVFSDAGFDMTWFIDNPTWSTPLPAGVATGGVLNDFPSTAEILIAPASKYAMIDRGDLSIGVTGNNIYRDNTSNKRNEFTYFFESFEGVVDTDSCPADLLSFQGLCYSGFQIADVAINCDGTLVDATQGAES